MRGSLHMADVHFAQLVGIFQNVTQLLLKKRGLRVGQISRASLATYATSRSEALGMIVSIKNADGSLTR